VLLLLIHRCPCGLGVAFASELRSGCVHTCASCVCACLWWPLPGGRAVRGVCLSVGTLVCRPARSAVTYLLTYLKELRGAIATQC
jgi:hypothetical protein